MALHSENEHDAMLSIIDLMLMSFEQFTPLEQELFDEYIGGYKTKEEVKDELLKLLYEEAEIADSKTFKEN